MTKEEANASGRWQSLMRFARVAVLGGAAVAVATGVGSGCLNRPVGTDEPRTTNIVVDSIKQTTVDKVDLLLMIDNSVSMADKQEILRAAVPDLVGRLVNPGCVDADGNLVEGAMAASPTADCPNNLAREFTPIDNINVAVITSSLGDGGAKQGCNGGDTEDNARLLGTLARGTATGANTLGYIEWRGGDQGTFATSVQALVTAAGESGCGFEASLEAWYRFLVDPAPWLQLVRVDCVAGSTNADCVVADGVDQEILNQRAAFLGQSFDKTVSRDGSLVAVIMLTDENDCSIRAGDQNWVIANINNDFREFEAAQICATNPNDPCCYSCGQLPPTGCSEDPSCKDANGAPAKKTKDNDEPNLRCWNQKARFGVDFLYPTDRYVNALSQPQLCLRRADLNPAPLGAGVVDCYDDAGNSDQYLVDNPLFRRFNLDKGRSETVRSPDLVFFAGIVGVPYQLIQANANQKGDAYPNGHLRYLTAAQLADPTLPGNPNGTSWGTIVPDESTSPPTPPTDLHMIESIEPRGALAGINSAAGADPFHGHEWNITGRNDLQFSCIFDLPEPRPCDNPDATNCDCAGDQALLDSRASPLCQQGNAYSNTQVAAKAYPGTRHLQVLRDFGQQSIVASICARNVSDTGAQDYGYRPAVDAIVDRLKEALSNRCVGRQLAVTPTEGGGGQPTATAPCSLVEVEVNPAAGCDCSALPARSDPPLEVREAVLKRMPEVDGLCSGAECTQACLCTLDQTPADTGALESCQYDIAPGGNVQGWCYVDPDAGYGNPALVAGCAATDRRILRFVPDQLLRSGTTTFVACFGASPQDDGRVIEVEQVDTGM